ncbi:Imm27 family immunity protein [Pontibacter flavimaris]|uniref:Uncharacterized protein n=1 Tax=Pontibacter flavimaris TaxID=1797110 RepID=A0A1Q5PI18_9BACT|nr:Imm27 family immunity protein [Pontibacter flavimaris]OKL41877.1 hypothetical protein A3841_07625 [Pontibacter flavimaris]
MPERKLYGDAKLIEALLSQMQLMEEAAGGWAAVYKDPASGRFWMKCYTTAGEQSGGGYQLLIRLPLPSTEELIGAAILSPHEDEAVAAIMRLLEEEAVEQKDFREQLLERLEGLDLASINADQKKRLREIITLTSLADPMNRREVFGKTAGQLEADVAYFGAISERARQLLQKL